MNKLQACEQRYANLKLLWERRVEESDRRLELLKECYKAIGSLPKDALGTGYISGTAEPYPLRDELLHNIAKELSDGYRISDSQE